MKLDDSARGSHDTVTRLINRMLESGVIDAAAHARLMSGGLPTNPHSMIGFLEALLAISLWRECVGTTQLAPTNSQCVRCNRYGQRCDHMRSRLGGE